MFREVYERDFLGFQVAPGISKTSGINLPILAKNGNGVAFAVDYDEGGRQLRDKIVKGGFKPESIYYLKASARGDSQLEDFINPRVLEPALIDLSESMRIDIDYKSLKSLRKARKLDAIAEVLRYQKIKDIPKTLLAYHILDVIHKLEGEPLIDPKKRASFEKFAFSIEKHLIDRD